MEYKFKKPLLLNLKFATFYHLTVFIFQLKNIESPGIIGEINLGSAAYLGQINYFLPQEIKYLEGINFIA